MLSPISLLKFLYKLLMNDPQMNLNSSWKEPFCTYPGPDLNLQVTQCLHRLSNDEQQTVYMLHFVQFTSLQSRYKRTTANVNGGSEWAPAKRQNSPV